ncbi:MAG: LptF/LptG family permease [Bacteroidota bacterium]
MKIRKLDVLMIKAFLGPFFLTTSIATFILLIQYLLKYFDDLVGKNLGFAVFGELLFYFSLNMLQNAIPLGVLVASLMTFGNLGEHFELTAIKSAGISLLRTLRPIFLLVCIVAVAVFFFNNYIIPAANLKAYSLLYDIKQTKPALDIKEGAFYNGIPDYSIKVKSKYPDGKSLKDIIIYDHTEGRGNKTVILADSSLMYTILDERYLKLELFNGHYYKEEAESGKQIDNFNRTNFEKMDLVFNMASFDLKRRNEDLFQNNRQMKNIAELTNDADSLRNEIVQQKMSFVQNSQRYLIYHFQNKGFAKVEPQMTGDSLVIDSASRKFPRISKASAGIFDGAILKDIYSLFQKQLQERPLSRQKPIRLDTSRRSLLDTVKHQTLSSVPDTVLTPKKKLAKRGKIVLAQIDLDTLTLGTMDEYLEQNRTKPQQIYNGALSKARNIKVNLTSAKSRVRNHQQQVNLYTYERDRKYAMSLACIIMFMIGAPLGAIIKKGGLGVPVIIAIFFFIVYYVIGSIGKQQTKELQLDPYTAAWMSNAFLLPFGLFFLRQARIDARLFDMDIYTIWIEKLKSKFAKTSK